jgi:multiple sugar transport system permease protein
MIRKITLYTLLSILGFISLFPFLWMLSTSFKTTGAVFSLPPQIVPDKLFKIGMWDNYKIVLGKYNFMRFTFNSIFVSFLASIGQLITCSLAGFAFARMQFKAQRIIFATLLATMMIPLEVTIVPEFIMMIKIGWVNTYAPLIVPSFMVGSFGTFLLTEFFKNIPQDLEDAATIDGCSSFRIYWNIFLPLAKPALATLFIIAFMNNWNALLRPVVYIEKRALFTLPIGLTSFQGAYQTSWNLLLAGSVISIIPLIVVYLFAQKYFIEGIATSGLKG